jgi:hypothetical protein
MLSSIRVRRALLIVVLAIGVLSMHGLATADSTGPHAPLTAMVDGLAGESHHGGHTDHDSMHAIGELCLWLIVAGIVFAAGTCPLRRLRCTRLESRLPVDRRATPASPAGRSPDAHLIGVGLRC